MKNFVTLIIAVVIITGSIQTGFAKGEEKDKAANTTSSVVTGKIVDKLTGEALVGVAVKIEGTDNITYTDFDGNFQFININSGTYNITTSYISYEKNTLKSINVSGLTNTLKVELKSMGQ